MSTLEIQTNDQPSMPRPALVGVQTDNVELARVFPISPAGSEQPPQVDQGVLADQAPPRGISDIMPSDLDVSTSRVRNLADNTRYDTARELDRQEAFKQELIDQRLDPDDTTTYDEVQRQQRKQAIPGVVDAINDSNADSKSDAAFDQVNALARIPGAPEQRQLGGDVLRIIEDQRQ